MWRISDQYKQTPLIILLSLGTVSLFAQTPSPPPNHPPASQNLLSTASEADKQIVEFRSLNRYAEDTTDFDEVDDSRNFTSEALFSESRLRLNRPLTESELREIVRVKRPLETFDTLRINPPGWPTIDVLYRYRHTEDAQITQFFAPNQFNDVTLHEFGIALQEQFELNSADVLVRGTYKRSEREGLIEFLPDTEESINNFEINAGISIKGLNIFPTYVFQDIDPDIPDPPKRNRHIAAIGFTYAKQSGLEDVRERKEDPKIAGAVENILERRFDIRQLELFGGFVYDDEAFGDTDVRKMDFYIGAAGHFGNPKACLPQENPFHLAIQPALFTSEVEGDPSQDNKQYRTTLSFVWDALRHPGELLVTVPFRHDVAVDGPSSYENWRVGGELTYRLLKNTRRYGLTAAVRYAHQSFYNVDKDVDLWGVDLNVEF